MKLRILHLEDNSADVELVRRALVRQGVDCDIRNVASGEDYVSALERARYDVILSDSGLPGYDGAAALHAARIHCPTAPFIVLSGHARSADAVRQLKSAGAAAHVTKSELKVLGSVIQSALQCTELQRDSYTATCVAGMKQLVGVVQRLSMARNLDAIMAIVRRAARELTGADGATFVLRDRDRCYYADEDAIAPLWKGQKFPLSACVSGWAMLNRQAAIIPDIYADSRVPHDAYRPTFVQSMVMMPIRSSEPIGAIGVYWAHPRRATTEEVDLLQALADSTSVAMESADILATLEQRVATRTAELEVVNRELEAFSYSVAHDLRTPLMTIDGFCQVLLEANWDSLNEEGRSHLEHIETAVSGMHRLIEDLLSLSRIVRAPLEKGPVDLSAIAQETAAKLRASASERSAQFVIAEGVGVQGDAGLLRIVLDNLMSNAWKFSSRVGNARIEFGTCEDSAGRTVCFVRDNGAGFDPHHAEKLFRPFYRLHTQAQFPGTGIGLATVQRVIHRHGGEIWGESQPGRGATFYFTLPKL